ncbi:hypothetical protein llap_9563 [Limosa lapponica baueri]|uniref:Mitochondrial fission process protein 1 n=1 Tax=Limosa lapponica baueri TaxID=1758121 RepID=A0A2I0U242_LIMLA|nr:hypothetical protein llap_9563 [Limosa lapponica baueri]
MPLSKGEDCSGPRDCGVFKLDVKGDGVDNIRPVFEAPEAKGVRESQKKHHKGRPPEEQHEGNVAIPANKSVPLGTQLKCLYTNACNIGNKQEELEMCAHLQGYDLIGITETWWDGSYDWSVGMESDRLFRKDRLGVWGGGVALYVNDQLKCVELYLGMDEDLKESLWVRIKGSAGAGDVTVCYRGLQGSATEQQIRVTGRMRPSTDR